MPRTKPFIIHKTARTFRVQVAYTVNEAIQEIAAYEARGEGSVISALLVLGIMVYRRLRRDWRLQKPFFSIGYAKSAARDLMEDVRLFGAIIDATHAEVEEWFTRHEKFRRRRHQHDGHGGE